MLDVVIKGGTIVDGTGDPGYAGEVGIRDGSIVSVGGKIDDEAHEVIDADGALVTPGFIDLHTHYDGQVTWDDALEPSATNGITTVVLGNCGVGFAPVKPEDHEGLIDMMEGVEDIPGAALTVGMPWGEWESFPEYLDLIDSRRYATNVAAHIAHGPLRYYVMGERGLANEDATAEDIAQMARLVREAVDAGAAGFSTNRYRAHMSRSGRPVPGTFAADEEVLAIAEALKGVSHGVIQSISDDTITPGNEKASDVEVGLFAEFSRRSGRPVTFSTLQVGTDRDQYLKVLEAVATENANGVTLRPQIIPRSVTFMTSLATYHMFSGRPTYRKLADLPLPQRLAEMRRPEVRDAILAEQPEVVPGDIKSMFAMVFGPALGRTYSLMGSDINYEPDRDDSVKHQAQALGKDPTAHMYDLLLEREGQSFFAILGSNSIKGSLDPCLDMLRDPNTVSGLSDAGAHVNAISDCSASTFHLTYWARDRVKGERVPVELAVRKLTGAAASMYGYDDRGVIAEGRRADVNVIDFDNLHIEEPTVRWDLPTGASRILQPSTGYLATLVNGELVRRNDTDTGARPGRLIRNPGK